MQQYLAIIEKAAKNYSAFLPDVPGCIATGSTVDETLINIQEALAFHLEGLIEEGESLPYARSLKFHLELGIFEPGKIGETYLIATLATPMQKVAA